MQYTTEEITRKRASNNQEGFVTETVTIQVPLEGTKLGVFKGKWTTCLLCGYTGPVQEMGEIGGKYYCNKYGCYESKE